MDLSNIIRYDEKGLVAAIAQDYKTNEVLMMAWMNKEAVQKTLETGLVHYYSRSRQKLWKKGEESGHIQRLVSISIDCDEDALLLKVEQKTAACHTGHYSCFFRDLETEGIKTQSEKVFDPEQAYGDRAKILRELYNVIIDRRINPKEGSYTNYLFEKGIDKILKKVGEEAAEVIIASKNNVKDEIVYETADLLYHLLVLLAEKGVQPEDIYDELKKRR